MNSLSDHELAILDRVKTDFEKRWNSMRKKYSENMGMGNKETRDRVIYDGGISYDAVYNIRNGLFDIVHSSHGDFPIILEACFDLFDFLLNELRDRLERPVKMCGAFGKPRKCPSKETGELRECMAVIWGPLSAALQYENTLRQPALFARGIQSAINSLFSNFQTQKVVLGDRVENARLFIESALQTFNAVDAAQSCRQFERIDNFAANVGKYTKDYLAAFRIMAKYCLIGIAEMQKPMPVRMRPRYNTETEAALEGLPDNNNNSTDTASNWNSESIGSNNSYYRGGRRSRTRRVKNRRSKTRRLLRKRA